MGAAKSRPWTRCRAETREHTAAAESYGRSIAILTPALGAAAAYTLHVRLLQAALGRSDEAVPALQAELAALKAARPKLTPTHAELMLALGRQHLDAGRADQAVPLVSAAHDWWQGFAPSNPAAAEAARWHASTLKALGRAG